MSGKKLNGTGAAGNLQFTPPNVKKYEYGNINGLRAFSALGIAAMHYQANLPVKPELGWLSDVLIPWFTNFVFLFFMISGFGLCCGYYDRMKNGEVSPDGFYSRRYRRVLPFFALLCAVDLAVGFSKESLAQAFMNCTLAFNLLPNPDMEVVGVGWFLGTVFLFYMLFPFFVFLLDNRRRAWTVFAVSLAVNFLCQEYFFTEAFVRVSPGRHNILYSAPFLLAGGLCFLHRVSLRRWAAGHGRLLLAACLAANALCFACPRSAWTLHGVAPLLAVFALWLAYAMGPEHGWLHNRVTDFLGGISMEFYLCHMVMFRAVEKAHLERVIRDGNLLFLATCAAGMGLAVVFSHCCRKAMGRLVRP